MSDKKIEFSDEYKNKFVEKIKQKIKQYPFMQKQLNAIFQDIYEGSGEELSEKEREKLIQDNAGFIGAFYDNNINCLNCPMKLDECKNKNKGYCTKLVYDFDTGYLENEIVPCDLTKNQLLISKNVIYSDYSISKIFEVGQHLEDVLRNYIKVKDSLKNVKLNAILVDEKQIKENKRLPNCHFYSKNSNAINVLFYYSYKLAIYKKTVSIVDCGKLFYDVYNSKYDKEFAELYKKAVSADYLFLTNFDNSPFQLNKFYETILTKLLIDRSNDNQTTFLSTKLSLSDMTDNLPRSVNKTDFYGKLSNLLRKSSTDKIMTRCYDCVDLL